MLAAISYPSWLKPEVIPGLPFRWYGIMYVVAFAVTWFLFVYESRRRKAPWSDDEASGFFFWAIVGLLLGARIFGTLVYDTAAYITKPWLIFWPFDGTGRFTGFQGMSFHGGFVGVVAATLLYARRRGLSWLAWADVIAVAAPLGYTAGRLGNFINGELWGKVSDRAWAMIFPNADRFSAREPWVQEFANKVGIPVSSMNDLVNLPRHPTQLYEAVFEGLVLWAVLWLIIRKRKAFPGFAVGCYALGYGMIRFAIEYFREPDANLGYVIKLGDPKAPIYLYSGLWNFSMGQVLSGVLVLGAVLFLVLAGRAARQREAEAIAQAASRAEAKAQARKLRKKLK